MLKKIISFIMAIILFLPLFPVINTIAENIDETGPVSYYVKQNSTGGIGTVEKPFGRIEQAINALSDKPGTIYIVDTYNAENGFWDMKNNNIVITAASSNSKLVIGNGIIFRGYVVLKDIQIDMCEWSHIGNDGGKLVIDNIQMPQNTMIHAGITQDGIIMSSDIVFEDGSADRIFMGGAYVFSSSSGVKGDSTITINGGNVNQICLNTDNFADGHTGITVGGNVNIIINGGNVNCITTYDDAKMNITGALNIIYNNGYSAVNSNISDDKILGGVYTVFSGIGGKVMPSENESEFIIKADAGKIAYINGEYVNDGVIKLNCGNTQVSWVDYEQYVEFEESKFADEYPSITNFPHGIESITDETFLDEEKCYPLNTGFDDYNVFNGIDLSVYGNELSLSENAYSGKFSLSINSSSEVFFPLRITEEFLVGQNNYISTNAISLKKYAVKTNLAELYINPGKNAEKISFYVSSGSGDSRKFSIIKSDVDGDGVFVTGEDFAQGKWQKVKLNLLNVFPEFESGKANGIYVKVNENSEWFFDELSSDYLVINHIDTDISKLVKDNLIVTDDGLQFLSKTDENGDVTYDTKPVVTTAKYSVNDKISSIIIDADYGNVTFEKEQTESDFLLEHDVAHLIDKTSWELSEGAVFENNTLKFTSGEQKFSFDLPQTEQRYKLYLNADIKKGAQIVFESGYKYVFKDDEPKGVHEIIVPNNIGTYMKIYADDVYFTSISEINFTIIERDSKTDSLIKNYKVTEKYSFDDTSFSENGIDYTQLPGFNQDYSGKTDELSQFFSSDFIVLRIVNASLSDECPYLYVHRSDSDYDVHRSLQYGECDYVIPNSPYSIRSINLYGNSQNKAMITGITGYSLRKSDEEYGQKTQKFNLPYSFFKVCDTNNIFLSDKSKFIYRYNAETGDDTMVASYVYDVKISDNGKYIFYDNHNDERYIYDVKTNETRPEANQNIYDKIVYLDNEGTAYYLDDKKEKIFSGDKLFTAVNDSRMICVSNDCEYLVLKGSETVTTTTGENTSTTLKVYKKNIDDGLWYFTKTLSYDYDVEIVEFINSKIYTKDSFIDLENEITANYSTSGNLVGIYGNDFVFSLEEEGYYKIFNSETGEEETHMINNAKRVFYYDRNKNNILYSDNYISNDYICVYNTITNESMIKSLLSFDGGKNWYTYFNGEWQNVHSNSVPDNIILQKYGMTASEIASIDGDAYEKLYENGVEIYSVNIAMLINSKSKKFTPTLKGITVNTVSDGGKDYMYSAKYKKYNKNEYGSITKMLTFNETNREAEGYYILATGKDWLYTYKSNSVIKLPRTENGLLSDIRGNWTTLKQYGMSEGEINRIPPNELNHIFLNEEAANTEFFVVYVYKTIGESTKNTNFNVKLLYEKKNIVPSEFTLTIYLTDGKILVYDSSSIPYCEAKRFMDWLTKRKSAVYVSDFYKIETAETVRLINYKNISYAELN